MTIELDTIAQDCILRSANSTNPRRVLTQHFQKAYDLGVQAGIRKTTDSMDKIDEESE